MLGGSVLCIHISVIHCTARYTACTNNKPLQPALYYVYLLAANDRLSYCLLQAEAARLQSELDELRSSHNQATVASEALTALQAKYDAAAAQLAALEGADERAAQLTVENDKLRERLEKTEGQVC